MPGADRILDFSLGHAHLCVRYDQLIVKRDGVPDASIPLAETVAVILSSRQVTCTLAVLDGLARAGAAVIVCDEAMLPSGMLLPLNANTAQTQRMLAQAAASKPTLKRLWQQVVRAKIRAQAAALAAVRGDDSGLRLLAARVQSGDPTNVEAWAAQRYWPLLFNSGDFRRDVLAQDQNRMLNYGYAVVRAAVARAVCAAGLHPSLGIHHHGRNNPFCLADDLMEPYRPLIDIVTAGITGELGGDVALTPQVKQRLVAVLHSRLTHDGEHRTVLEWIERSASSLARCLCADDKTVFFPDELVTP